MSRRGTAIEQTGVRLSATGSLRTQPDIWATLGRSWAGQLIGGGDAQETMGRPFDKLRVTEDFRHGP